MMIIYEITWDLRGTDAVSPHQKSQFQRFPSDGDRLDDKDTVDIHDNPPLPDNVVKEENNMMRHTPHASASPLWNHL